MAFVADIPGLNDTDTSNNTDAAAAKPSAFIQESDGLPVTYTWSSDQFMRWAALDGSDYFAKFGYEFVIYTVDSNGSGTAIDRLPLPLNPQSISVDVPAATQISTTMKGIVEESNGAPLRRIQISGVTGIYTSKAGFTNKTETFPTSVLDYFTASTARAINNTVASAQSTIGAITGDNARFSLLNYKGEEAKSLDIHRPMQTGYEFFHSLGRFFDFYLARKKGDHKIRLAFHMYRDAMYYDVVLNGYNFSKQAGTLDYAYNIGLTAYRRRKEPGLNSNRNFNKKKEETQDKAFRIQNIVNGLREAQKTVTAALGVLAGVNADFERSILAPGNELNILLTNAINQPRLAVDYLQKVGLESLAKSFEDTYYNNWKNGFNIQETYVTDEGLKDKVIGSADLTQSTEETLGREGNRGDLGRSLGGRGDPNRGQTQGGDGSTSDSNTSFPNSTNRIMTSTQPNGEPRLDTQSATLALGNKTIEELNLPDTVLEAIAREEIRIQSLTPEHFREQRDQMASTIASISEYYGGGDSTYNRINGLPAPKETLKTLDAEAIDILDKLNDYLLAYDAAIAYLDDKPADVDNSYYQYYQKQAKDASIPFKNASSIIYVPFPHGATLQSLALTYLGSVDRWTEIVAVNALKAPYIDEEGFEVSFIGSGAGNTATLPSEDNLFVGQKVKLSSDTKSGEIRKIIKIDVLTATEVLVTFDGDPTLSNYTVVDKAKLHAFRPGTINSNSLIAMPTDRPVNQPGKIRTAPNQEEINGLLRIAKMDIKLTDAGDVVFGGHGDVLTSFGLDNIIQAARLKVGVQRLDLLNDIEFGNPIQVGANVADINAAKYVKQLEAAFADDARFEGLQMARIMLKGPTASVNTLTRIANTNVYLPVEARVPI